MYQRKPISGIFKIEDSAIGYAKTYRVYYYSILDSKDNKYFIAPVRTIKTGKEPSSSRAIHHCRWVPATHMAQVN